MPPPPVRKLRVPSQSPAFTPPPPVSPLSGPCRRAKLSPPPPVWAFTSPVRSTTHTPPPPDLSRALNWAGTLMVYLASFWFRPLLDHDRLALPRSEERRVGNEC